jgi:hypothetical protein
MVAVKPGDDPRARQIEPIDGRHIVPPNDLRDGGVVRRGHVGISRRSRRIIAHEINDDQISIEWRDMKASDCCELLQSGTVNSKIDY